MIVKSTGCRAGLSVLLIAVAWLAVGCASLRGGKALPDLAEGMDSTSVRGLWGEPSGVVEYDDSLGHHVRWEYRRTVVGESMYWSMEPRQAGHGMTIEAVRRGRPYSRGYLAGWAVFREGRLVRWQTYAIPVEGSG